MYNIGRLTEKLRRLLILNDKFESFLSMLFSRFSWWLDLNFFLLRLQINTKGRFTEKTMMIDLYIWRRYLTSQPLEKKEK